MTMLWIGEGAFRRCRPEWWPFEDTTLTPDAGPQEGCLAAPDQVPLSLDVPTFPVTLASSEGHNGA